MTTQIRFLKKLIFRVTSLTLFFTIAVRASGESNSLSHMAALDRVKVLGMSAAKGKSTSGPETEEPSASVNQPRSWWDRDYLTGDTWGIRSLLEDRGIRAELIYTGESIFLVRGGVAPLNGHYLDNVDFQIAFDTQSLGMWRGGTFLVYALSNHGTDPSAAIGDMQVTSNIEAFDSIRLFEFWYSHVWLRGRLETLIGLHDLNSEFYTTDCGALFTNSSFGIGPDVSANAPVSIFNVSALGLRLRFEATDNLTVLAAVYDGHPGDAEENQNGLQIKWKPSEGLMSIYEFQFSNKTLPGMYRFGMWFHTAHFPHVSHDLETGLPLTYRGNFGAYFSIDQKLSQSKLGGDQGLFGFIHGGASPPNRSPVSHYLGFGVNYVGLPRRQDDVLGLGVASAFMSPRIDHSSYETAVEGTWQISVNRFLTLQPDVQFIVHPGGVKSSRTALVVGMRTEVNF